jgi:hypothetical protein
VGSDLGHIRGGSRLALRLYARGFAESSAATANFRLSVLDVICFDPQRVLKALVQFRGIHRASGADSDDSSGWEALFQ